MVIGQKKFHEKRWELGEKGLSKTGIFLQKIHLRQNYAIFFKFFCGKLRYPWGLKMGVGLVGLAPKGRPGGSIQFYYIRNSPFWAISVSAHWGCPAGK